jgi:hypothetical protein
MVPVCITSVHLIGPVASNPSPVSSEGNSVSNCEPACAINYIKSSLSQQSMVSNTLLLFPATKYTIYRSNDSYKGIMSVELNPLSAKPEGSHPEFLIQNIGYCQLNYNLKSI